MFSYGLKFVENNITRCGFPVRMLPKAMSIFEKQKINYILIDTRNNYDIDAKVDNKNLNTYNKIFSKAHINVEAKERIEKINKELLRSIEKGDFKEKIEKVEKVIYEARKI